MKILLLNQFFWPDTAATSQLLTDLAQSLAEREHEVYAICAGSSYAVAGLDTPPAVHINPVRALRFGRGTAGRILSYASFYVTATFKAMTMPRPDLVIALTTPPLLPLLGVLVKKLRGARFFIWEMDLYPDVAVDLGYFKAGGILDRFVGALADYSRQAANGVLAIGDCMKDRLIERGIPSERIFVVDNWADGKAIQPMPRSGDPDKLVLLYSGNLGLAHDLDTMLSAIRALRNDLAIAFVFAGGGGRRKQLESICQAEQITNVQFLPYAQRSDLNANLNLADIGLVTQRASCCGSVVPSKVYGLLAAGKPVLFIGPDNATPARIIRNFHCGWHIQCGDHGALISLLAHLRRNPAEITNAAVRARRAFLDYYDLPIGTSRICSIVGADSPAVTNRNSLAASSHAVILAMPAGAVDPVDSERVIA